VKADVGLFSPSTGIIDSHKLMYSFLKTAESRDAIVVYRSKVTGIDYDGSYYVVEVNEGEYRFKRVYSSIAPASTPIMLPSSWE